MDENGLFVDGSLSILVQMEKETITGIFKIIARQVDLEHMLKTGTYKQELIPLDYSYLKATLLTDPNITVDTVNWKFFPSGEEPYFLAAASYTDTENDPAASLYVVMGVSKFSVYLKPRGNYFDDEFIMPSPGKEEIIQNLPKIMACINNLVKNFEGQSEN